MISNFRLFSLQILSLIFFSFIITSSALGQEDYKAENEGWHVILEEAYAESKESGKPILANFTGSDWCGWCKKLTRDVFVKADFQAWAEDNVILLELDYPRRKQIPSEIKQQNAGLQQAFKIRGYPSIWVFDLDKDDAGQFNISALGKTGYRPSSEVFIEDIEKMLERRKS